jgi:hypothetical protein
MDHQHEVAEVDGVAVLAESAKSLGPHVLPLGRVEYLPLTMW